MKAFKKLLKGLDDGVLATCNIVLFSELVDFDTADQNCKNFNIGSGRGEAGNLATVNDAEKNKDLKTLLEMAYPIAEQPKGKWGQTHWVWGGLRKTEDNNNPDPGPFNPLFWEWADGSNPLWSNWLRSQPDQRSLTQGSSGCTQTVCYQNQMRINHKGQWDDTYTFKVHPYACDYRGKYILSKSPKTWHGAKAACEEAGLHLAKIRNVEEVEEIKQAAVYFLGQADPTWGIWDKNNWIWTGGSDAATEGDWRWLDNTPVEDWKLPWRRRAGNDNAGRRGQHVLSISRWGEFDDSRWKKKRPFACQCPGS